MYDVTVRENLEELKETIEMESQKFEQMSKDYEKEIKGLTRDIWIITAVEAVIAVGLVILNKKLK